MYRCWRLWWWWCIEGCCCTQPGVNGRESVICQVCLAQLIARCCDCRSDSCLPLLLVLFRPGSCCHFFVTGKAHGRRSHTVGESPNWLVQNGGPINRFVVFLVGQNGNGVVASNGPLQILYQNRHDHQRQEEHHQDRDDKGIPIDPLQNQEALWQVDIPAGAPLNLGVLPQNTVCVQDLLAGLNNLVLLDELSHHHCFVGHTGGQTRVPTHRQEGGTCRPNRSRPSTRARCSAARQDSPPRERL